VCAGCENKEAHIERVRWAASISLKKHNCHQTGCMTTFIPLHEIYNIK